ncbi:MAG: pentapeptide repeat-containing protein [Cyanobacteria bacterium J06555_13]
MKTKRLYSRRLHQKGAKTLSLKPWRQLPALVFSVLLLASPVLADTPGENVVVTRRNNMQRLRMLNACANCDLMGANLTQAYLIGADLRGADLRFANLTGSNLEGADLTGADLTGADLTRAYLTDANLANATIHGVNFTKAHLYNVNLTGASVENVNLAGAEVHNTDISVGGPATSVEQVEEGRQP